MDIGYSIEIVEEIRCGLPPSSQALNPPITKVPIADCEPLMTGPPAAFRVGQDASYIYSKISPRQISSLFVASHHLINPDSGSRFHPLTAACSFVGGCKAGKRLPVSGPSSGVR